MSKPIKSLVKNVYRDRFGDLEGAVLIDIRGINAQVNNALRADLAKKQIRVTVVSNNLAKSALSDTMMKNMGELLTGSNAVVYGGASVVEVARELIEQAKKIPTLQFKGAIMDGQVFTPDQVEALSKYPTKDEAQAQVIQVILGAAGQLIGAATGIGGQILSIIEQVEEKLEKGEAITKVA